MVRGTVRETREGFVVEIPREEVERLSLHDGQSVAVELRALPRSPERAELAADLQDAFEIEFVRAQAGLRYLAEH